AINDAFAIEMVYHLRREKIRIPEDIAIVGFNNELVSEFVDPPLTSVDSPANQLGEEAARLLLRHINDGELKPTVKVLKSKLVIRKSSLKKGI
ncbi:MAG: substrate-binding domain-containing protein, partial [Bacteroidota bacterium]